MERERVALTAHELRVLADVESTLRRDDPDLERALGRRSLSRRALGAWSPPARPLAVLAASVGMGLMSVGLLLANLIGAFAGFVLLLMGVHRLVRRWELSSSLGRARAALGLEPASRLHGRSNGPQPGSELDG